MARQKPDAFAVEWGPKAPDRAAGGRPRDPRLADICARAAAGLACGQFDNTRDAANAFVAEYKGKAYEPSDRITHNEAANDLRSAIERHIAEATERSR